MRVPPHSLEAERSLLGALLLDTEAFEEVSALITPEDFYKEPHRHIYRSMEQVAGRNEAIDVVTLVQQLRDEGRLDAVGGLSYIAGLSSAVPTAANVAFYAGLVRKKSLLRRVISVSAEISEECYGDVGDVEGFINSAEARLMELSSSKANSAVRSLKDVVKEAYYQIESLYERDETITGVPSGFVDLDNKTAGWQSSDLIIVAARPAMGKCVSADAEILLDSGEVVTMEELMRRRAATLLTLRDDWRFEPRSPSAYVDDGHKPLFEITTRLGRRLKVTWTHPLLTPNGWRPLGTLSIGQRIAVPRALPIFGTHQPRRAEAILLGYLLGDGTLTSATPRFTQQDPRLQRDFEGAAAAFPEWIQVLEVMGCDAHQKFIPAEVFCWEREALSLFLNRLFATDGWATRLASGQVQVGYATVSERLARQLQHLLLRFGVIAKLRQRHVHYRGERREAWQLDITHAESLRSFAKNINIFTKEEALRPFLEADGAASAGLDTIPVEIWAQLEEARGSTSWAAVARLAGLTGTNLHVGRRALGRERLLKLAQALQSPPLQALAQSQVYWDEIVSIKAVGEAQVYDLTIPETHNFIANDICVHNTAFTLNMASNAAVRFGKVVLFCSLEMSAPQLAMRLMASEARVDVSRLRVGALKESEWGRLIQATATLSKAPIFIDDSAGLTTQMLTSRARRLKVEHGLDMIIIDYLQLIGSARPVASREQHISEVSRTLKMLAKEMHIPVIALAQLNRGVESRADKRPMLSDLRECVVAQTPVLLADGRRVPIAELVGQAPMVLAYDEVLGRVIPAMAEKVWCVGRRPVSSLQLASGRTLKATALHRLYGPNGWVRVADLRPGDRLALARSLPAPSQDASWPQDRLILLGHMLGDGSYLTRQPMRYTTCDEENSRWVRESAQSAFQMTVTRHEGRGRWHQLVLSGNGNRWQPAGMNLWLKSLGIFNQRSHEKHLPEEVFSLNNESVKILIAHMWATDGSIWSGKGKTEGLYRGRIYYSTTSLRLAHELIHLLLRLGIHARLRRVRQGTYKDSFHVDISGIEQQLLFLQQIQAIGPRAKQKDLFLERLSKTNKNTNVDTMPEEIFDYIKLKMKEQKISQREMAARRGTSYGGHAHFDFAPSRDVVRGYAEILGDAWLMRQTEQDIFWDTLLAVEDAGEEEVFDLTVPGVASWLADGIVSHNSGAIEQDADIISFVYRDEYYNPDSEQKGIAEVILGKHRSGSTGTVELRFFPEFTRFENLARAEDDQ